MQVHSKLDRLLGIAASCILILKPAILPGMSEALLLTGTLILSLSAVVLTASGSEPGRLRDTAMMTLGTLYVGGTSSQFVQIRYLRTGHELAALIVIMVIFREYGAGVGGLLFPNAKVINERLNPLGDLSESYLKREVKQKDSGNVLGPAGGILDTMDAFLFAGVVAYQLFLWGY